MNKSQSIENLQTIFMYYFQLLQASESEYLYFEHFTGHPTPVDRIRIDIWWAETLYLTD
jgi:hypothetical protein